MLADLSIDGALVSPQALRDQLANFDSEMVARLDAVAGRLEALATDNADIKERLDELLPVVVVARNIEAALAELPSVLRGVVAEEVGKGVAATAAKIDEAKEEIIDAIKRDVQPRVEEGALDFVNAPSLAVMVYDRDDECAEIVRALRGELSGEKVWLVVAPSTFGKTFLAVKVLQQVAAGQRITAPDVRKILYFSCRDKTVANVVTDLGALLGQSKQIAQAFGARGGGEPLADWLSKNLFQPLQTLGPTWLLLDNFEAWLDAGQGYAVKRGDGSASGAAGDGDELRQFVLSFFQKNHDVRVLLLSQAKPALTGNHAPRVLDAIGHAMYRGLPKTDARDYALDYLRTEGKDVGLSTTSEAELLEFINLVQRNPMALTSLVSYLRTVKDVSTFEELVRAEKLFDRLNEYEHAEDRTKYLVKKQIAAQADELKVLLCALAFFNRPLPQQALEIFLPAQAEANIARLVSHKLATLSIGARKTRRFELHALFREMMRQDESYARFLAALDGNLAASFGNKGIAAYDATYFLRAIDLYDCALAIYQFLTNEELANDLAAAYVNKGVALDSLGQLKEAVAEYEKAIAIRERLVNVDGRGELASDLAAAYVNKGVALDSLGQLKEAVAEYEKAIAILERLVNVDGRGELASDLAMAYANKANTLAGSSEWAEAAGYYDRAAQLWAALILQAGRLELLPSWVKLKRLKLQPQAKLENWAEVATNIVEVLSLFIQLMQSGQVPNPDAANQELAHFIYTLRAWPEADREQIYAAAGAEAESLRQVIEGQSEPDDDVPAGEA